MHMGHCVAVEPLNAVYCAYADDLALILEHGQVPVNSTQGNVRIFLLQVVVDHFSGGVGVRASQVVQDRVALAELLGGSFHRLAPF